MVPQDVLPGGHLVVHTQSLVVQQPGRHTSTGYGQKTALFIPTPLTLVHQAGEYPLTSLVGGKADCLRQQILLRLPQAAHLETVSAGAQPILKLPFRYLGQSDLTLVPAMQYGLHHATRTFCPG